MTLSEAGPGCAKNDRATNLTRLSMQYLRHPALLHHTLHGPQWLVPGHEYRRHHLAANLGQFHPVLSGD